jgi:ribosomal protein L3
VRGAVPGPEGAYIYIARAKKQKKAPQAAAAKAEKKK